MKKSLVLLMCFVFAGSLLLTACSDSNNSASPGASSSTASSEPSSASSESSGEATPDPNAKYDPPVTVTTVRAITADMKLPEGQTYEDNVWTRTLREEYGIDTKVLWNVDGGQYDNKLNMSIASGDLPDLMKVSSAQFKQLLESDSLADLTEVYEKYASEEMKKQHAIGDGIALKTGMIGDKLYALPDAASAIGGAPSTLIWIRADWLKKLGLEEPKSLEDVFAIARAFTKNDPDGNNKADTTGIVFEKGFLSSGLGNRGLFNSFDAFPQSWIADSTGNLVYGSIQPEVKTALQALQDLYKEGLLDKEFIVKDAGKVIETLVANKAGIAFGPHYFGQFIHQTKVQHPEVEWKPFPLMRLDGSQAKVSLNSPTLGQYVVRKGYSNPEVIVKMMNLAFDITVGERATKENYDKYMYDPKDGTIQIWNFAPVFSNDSTDALFQQIIDATEANDPTLAKDATAQLVIANAKKAREGEHSLYGWTLYSDAWKIYFDLMNKGLYVNNGFYGVPTPTMTDKQATLDQLELETFSKIIMNAAPIDDFDKFVENWKKLGGDQVTKEVNEWKQTM